MPAGREAPGSSQPQLQRATKETHERAERASVVSGSARASVAAKQDPFASVPAGFSRPRHYFLAAIEVPVPAGGRATTAGFPSEMYALPDCSSLFMLFS